MTVAGSLQMYPLHNINLTETEQRKNNKLVEVNAHASWQICTKTTNSQVQVSNLTKKPCSPISKGIILAKKPYLPQLKL